MPDNTILIGIGELGATILGASTGWWASRRKRKSELNLAVVDDHKALVEGYSRMVSDLREEVSRIRKQYVEDMQDAKTQRKILSDRIDSLEGEIKELNEKFYNGTQHSNS